MVAMVQGPISDLRTLPERLKAADVIRSIADAPVGSRLAAMRDAVPEAWSTVEALRARRQRVWTELERANRALQIADETADFAGLAEDLVRVEVLDRVVRNLDSEIQRANQVANGTERAAKDAWLRLMAAREQLRDMLQRGEVNPTREHRYLRVLSDLVDVTTGRGS